MVGSHPYIPRPQMDYPKQTPQDVADFQNPHLAGRRLLAEAIGSFCLVLVAAGSGVIGARFPGTINVQSAGVAVAFVVVALILMLGRTSGAHFNAAVTLAFALARSGRS